MFSVAAAPETPNDKISYKKAADYWDKIDPSIEGMLGGFGTLTELDCATSIRFITEFCTQTNSALALDYACDCGAGIGRVSKNFLLNVFKKVDLVEQNPKFLEQAKVDYMKEEVAAGKVGDFFPLGLQDFNPEVGRYDMIWSQWVLGHLTDGALKPNGVIGVKENVCPRGVVELDEQDSSVTRPAKALEAILKRAVQTGFPRGLYPVNMYILQ
ncbi:DUF858-domain-containing protein [Rhizoclosmatium globosum]|uniref:Alpha N-terminal protein methyltransferase 1 n=1 Tax=Rhizoclosmatium globosum TaxID=329046 RepID=A0A1Y2AVD9_9FUNG|nr:DUF858-domain-containing protein [Rhizoclosmatium globosum]|eukprot:ORY26446.1 DUF858-domain-containing protein [Rhizoclosmatium globosum]